MLRARLDRRRKRGAAANKDAIKEEMKEKQAEIDENLKKQKEEEEAKIEQEE